MMALPVSYGAPVECCHNSHANLSLTSRSSGQDHKHMLQVMTSLECLFVAAHLGMPFGSFLPKWQNLFCFMIATTKAGKDVE